MDESLSANLSGPALFQGRAAGVGQPFTESERLEGRDQWEASLTSFYALALRLMRSHVRGEISGQLFQSLTSGLQPLISYAL